MTGVDAAQPLHTTGSARFPEYAPDERFAMLIGDTWQADGGAGEFACLDPFENRAWGRLPIADAADVDRAVRAARSAFPAWSRRTPAERGRVLRRWAELIESRVESLARLQVHENGKTLAEMRMATAALVAQPHFYSALAEMPHGVTVDSNYPGHEAWTKRVPLGVVALIAPWNNPLVLLANKLFPALAAGNTVVVKPSEITPASTLALAELALNAGLPPGVLNVVTGPGDPTGRALVAHPDVRKIGFTGSVTTGRAIAHAAADRSAGVTLELGGKSPNIVFADADLDRAVEGLLAGVIAGHGQACNAGSRILIESRIHDEVVERLVAAARAVRLGDPLDAETQMGPMAFPGQLEKVLGYFDIAREEGHRLLTGGDCVTTPASLAPGLFVPPTLYADVDNRSRLAREEIFGPVAAIMRFDSEAEAVALANDTDFGLFAGAWTQDVSRAHRMVAELEAGTVWINTWRVFGHQIPFGGMKASGLGRENGAAALEAYTEEKAVWMRVFDI